jgi:hypothetical protein
LDPAETENVGFKKGKGLRDVKALLRVETLGMNDVLMAFTIDGLRLDGGKVDSSVGTDEAMKLSEVVKRSKLGSPDKSRAEVAFRADGKLALEFDYAEGVIGWKYESSPVTIENCPAKSVFVRFASGGMFS